LKSTKTFGALRALHRLVLVTRNARISRNHQAPREKVGAAKQVGPEQAKPVHMAAQRSCCQTTAPITEAATEAMQISASSEIAKRRESAARPGRSTRASQYPSAGLGGTDEETQERKDAKAEKRMALEIPANTTW
jgi:hypothetical protein